MDKLLDSLVGLAENGNTDHDYRNVFHSSYTKNILVGIIYPKIEYVLLTGNTFNYYLDDVMYQPIHPLRLI